jgi:hypothetical protein
MTDSHIVMHQILKVLQVLNQARNPSGLLRIRTTSVRCDAAPSAVFWNESVQLSRYSGSTPPGAA